MTGQTLHGEYHADTWRFQLVFRGSQPKDMELARLVRAEARRDGVDYVEVIRAALRARFGLPDQP